MLIELIMYMIISEKYDSLIVQPKPLGVCIDNFNEAKIVFNRFDNISFVIALRKDNTWAICYNLMEVENFLNFII